MGRAVEPADKEVTGFVFKVQANMDPNHRDRVAFLRLASGEFRRNMKLKQSGTGKSIGVHNPILFFASERETVDEAWPGDIIGIPNHGTLAGGRHAVGIRRRGLHRHSQFRAGNICAGCGWPIR